MNDKTKDTAGKPYAKLSETKPGDLLVVDAGFTCLKAGAQRRVKQDRDGELYIECADGGHTLSGQADDGEHIVGLYRA